MYEVNIEFVHVHIYMWEISEGWIVHGILWRWMFQKHCFLYTPILKRRETYKNISRKLRFTLSFFFFPLLHALHFSSLHKNSFFLSITYHPFLSAFVTFFQILHTHIFIYTDIHTHSYLFTYYFTVWLLSGGCWHVTFTIFLLHYTEEGKLQNYIGKHVGIRGIEYK